MRAISYIEARKGLASELDRVVNDHDVTIITRKNAEAGVLMSIRNYESLMETSHLLWHPKNAMRLMKAIDDIEAQFGSVQVGSVRNLVQHELIEE